MAECILRPVGWKHLFGLWYDAAMEFVEAEFEDGVLRPVRRLALRQGERVGLVVVRRPDPARWDLARLSRVAGTEDQVLAEEGLGDWASALDREDGR
jgi:predicted DNA-binding antitoxin AbrB/MazE fold protein